MASHLTFKIVVIGDENVGKTTIVNYYTLLPASFTSTVGIDFQSRIIALSAEEIDTAATADAADAADDDDADSVSSSTSSTTSTSSSSTSSSTRLLKKMENKIKSGPAGQGYGKCDYVKCYFWDTSGAPQFQSLSHSYYSNVSGVFIVFDLSNQKSYNNLYSYINRAIQKNTCIHKHPILVIGNKVDKRTIKKTYKQIHDDLCSDFPYEKIKYAEVSCLDTSEKCSNCAGSSDVHYTITSFLQFMYDSVIKPHYYNSNAIADIGCAGINGTSRYFRLKEEKKQNDTGFGCGYKYGGGFISLKKQRECCDEQYRSSAAGCNCSIL